MIKKLSKHGNSYALVIDRSIMDLLNISEKSALYVTTDGRNLVISPVGKKGKKADFDAVVEKSFKKFPRMYRKLAG